MEKLVARRREITNSADSGFEKTLVNTIIVFLRKSPSKTELGDLNFNTEACEVRVDPLVGALDAEHAQLPRMFSAGC